MKFISPFFYCILSLLLLVCSGACAQVSVTDINAFLNDSAVRTGHAGISIYEPATGKYLYEHNADKNFTPSSNVKLFTLYAGMKYLRDSLPGIRYYENDSALLMIPAGDPTLLHRDFSDQPVIRFLSSSRKNIKLAAQKNIVKPYGPGWAWDDYNDDYMAERSVLPVYGNTVLLHNRTITPALFSCGEIIPGAAEKIPAITREFYSNRYWVNKNYPAGKDVNIPFITSDSLSRRLLSDAVRKNILPSDESVKNSNLKIQLIRSRPVDSLFRPMMFNSDNFFAEQTLLMVSNERLGYMGDEAIIDTLLKTDLKDIPTKPRWVDGSGLSRYNLFSPKDFVYILDKLQKEFGMERMKRVLPTGGQGTLTNYYEKEAGSIYAKTGSMNNNVSLSGYLFTKKNKLLLFSVIINNYTGSGRTGRQVIEKLLRQIRETN